MKKLYRLLIFTILALCVRPVVSHATHTITPFTTLNFCTAAYPTAYQNTVLFTLNEVAFIDFNPSQANKTIVVTLPAGFEFNPAAGPTVTRGGSNTLTINSFTWTTTAITVTMSTTNNITAISNVNFNNFQIRAIAAGSGDLARSGGTFTVDGSVNIPAPAESFGHLNAGPATTYASSSVIQYTTSNIVRNCSATKNPILEIRVDVVGSVGCPATITQFNLSTVGDVGYSQNPLVNITRASIYYSGLTQGFSYASFFGSVLAPNGAFTINGSQSLQLGSGTYYFYLTYDVPVTANIGNGLDASLTSFVCNAVTINSATTPNPAGIRTIVAGTCPSAPDLPNPPANLQTITAGSLIIPMDNAHQNLWLTYPFNIKSYGLVNALLQADIPVKWVITSGKAKDAIDFSAVCARVYPTAVAPVNQDFRAGEFVVDSFYVNHSFYSGGQTATQVMSAFAVQWKVAVYLLTVNKTVDVRYTLNHRPKIAVFSNGGNEQLQYQILDSAKITNYVVIGAGAFTGLADCYTFCSEAHWDYATNPDVAPVQNIVDFVNQGGNFLAQCAGIDLYENHQPQTGHFQTTNGITFQNTVTTNTYSNADMAFNQFEGVMFPRSGTIATFQPAASSVYKPEMYYQVSAPTPTSTVVATASHLTDPDSVGSNVFYLGGHDYATGQWGTLSYINGTRMYLNAALVPAHRPTAFTLSPGANRTICSGQSTTLGGSPTGPISAVFNWTPSASLSSSTAANPIATPTVTTTYTVTAFDGSCPGGPSYVTVTVNPTPAAPTASSNSPICAGSTLNLTASNIVGATYSWTGPNAFSAIIQNPTIPSATIAAAGTYSVTATLAGCLGPAGTTVVTVTPTPAAPTASSNSAICAGSTLNLTSSVIAGATYSWTGPNAFSSALQKPTIAAATVAASGTYSVTATVAGCTGPAGTTVVVVNPIPAAPTASSNSAICAGSTLNLTSSVIAGATYSWTGPNAFSSALQNPTIAAATVAASGTYSVTATVAGCTGPAGTTVVVVNPIPGTPTPSSNSPICAGATLNLTTPLVVGASYAWTGPLAYASALQNPSILNATVGRSGTYTLTVTVAGCTSGQGTTVVTVNPTPAAPAASSNSPICAGSTLNLTASFIAGVTYSWSGPNAFSAAIQNPSIVGATVAASGTYSVHATLGGCTGPNGTTVVVVNAIPAAPTASSNSPICAGSNLNLTASVIAGATYSWTGPNAFSSAIQNPTISAATVAASGTYSVTATVAGCTGSAGTTVVTVNPIPAPPTASSNSPICAGSTLNLTASNIVGATYSWAGPNLFFSVSQNPNIVGATVAASGTYSVTASVAGCNSAAATTVVVVNPIPSTPAPASNSPICAGQNLNLTSTLVASATYSWTGPNTFTSASQNPSIVGATIAASGTYSLTVTVNGCTSPTGTTTVIVNIPPTAPTVSSNSPVCTGTSLNLTASFVVGCTYSWTGPNSFSSALQNPSIANITLAGAGTYTVVVNNGCSSLPATVVVVVNPTPATPTASSNSAICDGSTLNLTASNIAGVTYSWTGPNGFTSSSQNPSIVGATTAASGTYSVTATSAAGCTGNAGTTVVVVHPIPVTPTPSSNSPVCTGAALNLTTNLVAGATYSWSGPNAFSSALQNPTIASATLAAAGTYSLTITVLGCGSAIGTTTVIVFPTPPAPTASSNSPICDGNTLNLSANNIAGATYSWSGPNGFTDVIQNPSIVNATLAANGTYSVNVTVNGCVGPNGTTTVIVNPIPAAPSAGSNSPICAGQTLNLTASNVVGATYSWNGPNGFSSTTQNPSITNATIAATGTYTVTTTINGCTSVDSIVTATINATPMSPVASSNSPVCSGNTLLLSADTIAGATWLWVGPNGFTSTQQNPSITNVTVAATGTYTVTANNGCSSIPTTIVVVVNATPTTPIANNNGALCIGTTLNLTTSNVVGATYSWTGPNGFSASTQNPSIPNVTVANAGTYSLTVTVNGCSSATGTTIVVISIPAVVSAGADQTVCANNNVVALTGTSSTGTGIWTTTGSGTFTPNATTLNASYHPSNADTATGVITLTFTSTTNGGCSAVNDQMVVTITNAPTVNAGLDQTVCANNSVTTLNGSFTTSSGALWSTSGSGTFAPSASAMNGTYTPSAADTSAGTVTLYLTSTGNGTCLAVSDSMVITITPAPLVNAGSNVSVCVNNPNVLLSGSSSTGTGTWSSNGTGSFSPNPNALNGTYIPSAADISVGTIFIFLNTSNNGNCSSVRDTITVTFSPPPTVNAGINITTCANNGAVSLNGISSTANGTWTSTGSGIFTPNANTLNATYTPSAADTAAGTVTLTLTTTNNGGCIAVTDQLTITITDSPIANAGVDQSICSNNAFVSLNGSVSIASGGTWTTTGSGTFSPSANALNATYTASGADTTAGIIFLVLTTTGNGLCNAVTDTMMLTIFDAPHVNAGVDAISCVSSPNTPMSGTSTTGSGTWTTSGTGTFSPNANTLNATYIPSAADLLAGNVTLTLTSTGNGSCFAVSDLMNLQFQAIPSVTTGPNQTVCANNAAVLLTATSTTGTGIWTTSGTGTFSPSATTLNATYSPSGVDTAAGNVTLTFTSTNGCTPISQNVIITITPAPFVNAGPDLFTCANNPNASFSAVIGGGSNTGSWTTTGTGTFSPSTNSLNGIYTPSASDILSGSVLLILTSANNGNCMAVADTVVLTITFPPVANAGPDAIACANNAAGLTGTITAGSGTGIWTTPNGTGTFLPSNTTLNASYTPSNADTAVGLVMLILTSTNNGGCLAVADTMYLQVNPGPIVNAGADLFTCSNNPNVILNGTVTIAAGGVWTSSGTGTFTPDSVTLNATYIPSAADILSDSVTIYLTSTGNGLCTSVTDSLQINFTPSPIVNAGPSQIICTGTTSVSLSGTISGGSLTGQWSTNGNGTFNPNDSTLNATYVLGTADTTAGSVTLYLTSTNNGNCNVVIDSMNITITPIPTSFAGNDTTVCANNNAIVLSGQIIGGAGTGYWTTLGSGTFAPDSSALNGIYVPSIADTTAGSVTLVLTSTNGCLASVDTVVITFAPAPSVSAGSDALICAGETVSLNGGVSNATVIHWSTNGDGTFTPNDSTLNAIYIPGPIDTASGSVTITITSSGNAFCSAVIDSLVININSKPNAMFGSGPACVNSPVTFTDQSSNTNGAIVSWNWTSGINTSTLQNPSFTFANTGMQTVTLIVATAAGCSDTLTRTVYVNPSPQAAFTSVITCPTDLALSDSSLISSGTIVSWNWNLGDSTTSAFQNTTHTYADTGVFVVTLTVLSDSGCVSTQSDTLIFIPCVNGEVNPPVVPSAFTPNGDGHNDVLYVKGGPFKQLDFRIYNEWGNMIFHSESQSIGWDGNYKSKVQPEGPYVWTIVGTTADGVEVKASNVVTIIR